MSILQNILAHNEQWVRDRLYPLKKSPHKKVAIFTCMDTRLVDFLEPALGLKRGDAKVIKNAGNTIIDKGGAVIRSLVVAIYALGCEEIYIIGHTDCGMSDIDEDKFQADMLARGVPAQAIADLQPGLSDWLGTFHDPIGNVDRMVDVVRESPLIPADVPIHGLIFDSHTGKLEVIKTSAGSSSQ